GAASHHDDGLYYIMTADLEKKEKVIKYNAELILKMLDPDERKVIKKIVSDHGKVQQMEISYMEGFGKVRAHRVLETLIAKGILEKEKMGKQRIIRMKPEFLEMLDESR
ncbi:MAG: hypothetical protein NDI94_02780, partial [Candidatus Woesearchaeota archaeon]|nr:hypothetical protein [Candidatus Woesearchaeota archaeon]